MRLDKETSSKRAQAIQVQDVNYRLSEVRGKAQGITPIWDDSKNSKINVNLANLNHRPKTATRNGSKFGSLAGSNTLREKLIDLENV